MPSLSADILTDLCTRYGERPVLIPTLFLLHRSYTPYELSRLKNVASDASKALGRSLTAGERRLLVRNEANSIGWKGILNDPASVMIAMIIAYLINFVHESSPIRMLYAVLALIVVNYFYCWAIWQYKKKEFGPEAILQDPRMRKFRQTLSARRADFGGHLPHLIASGKARSQPIQWFKDGLPRDEPTDGSLPYISHPDLEWHCKEVFLQHWEPRGDQDHDLLFGAKPKTESSFGSGVRKDSAIAFDSGDDLLQPVHEPAALGQTLRPGPCIII